MGWTDEVEEQISRRREQLQGYQWMAHESSRRYARLHLWVSLPGVCVNAGLGTLSLSDASSEIKQWVGAVNLVLAIWSAGQSFCKFGKMRDDYRAVATEARQVSDRIQLTMMKPRRQRGDADAFAEKLFADYTKLVDATPNFPAAVRQRYYDFASGKRSLPDIFLSTDPPRHKRMRHVRDIVNAASEDEPTHTNLEV